MKIPEGSKIIIKDHSYHTSFEPVEAYEDLDIEPDAITMLDGWLCSIDGVRKTDEYTFEIDVYAQDAVLIKDGYMKQSAMESD